MDARYLPPAFVSDDDAYYTARWRNLPSQATAHIPPDQRKGPLPLDFLLNTYPSQVSKRSRVKNARQFITTGWRAVSISKFIAGMRYHSKSGRLYVDFKNGGLGYYHMGGSDPQGHKMTVMAAEFFIADSHGKFLHERLKRRCSWVSIRDGGKGMRGLGTSYSQISPAVGR